MEARTPGRAARGGGGFGSLLVGGAAGLVVGATALFAMAPGGDGAPGARTDGRRAPGGTHAGTFPGHEEDAHAVGPHGTREPRAVGAHSCQVRRHEGRTYAGHSATARQVLGIGSRGAEVVEAQCLLREAGFAPWGAEGVPGVPRASGGVSGVYGTSTVGAVRRFQVERGLVADGTVGPGTWAALRR